MHHVGNNPDTLAQASALRGRVDIRPEVIRLIMTILVIRIETRISVIGQVKWWATQELLTL